MSARQWLYAYIDESGNTSLDVATDGTSNYFICVAIIVNDEQRKVADAKMREISSQYFSGAEVKGSRIGPDNRRRLRVLGEISQINFGYFALVVDKGRIRKDSALRYKRTFYKFLNRMLYDRLLITGLNLHIIPDEIGGKDFMNSFDPYLLEKGAPNLFTEWDHRFAASHSEPLIQLADVVANTLTYCFDPDKKMSPALNLESY